MSKVAVTIRGAVAGDTPTLLRLIHELAAHEQRADTCTVTERALHEALFGARPRLDAIIAERGNEVIGFALYFSYFSPNVGVLATFMELLYVIPEQRGRGAGRALLQRVAQVAVAQGADRLEWGVMKRNEPAIGFYDRLGATFVDDFFACRLDGDTLRRLAHGA